MPILIMPVLIISKRAEKDFIDLPKVERQKVVKKLKAIQTNPYSGKPLTGKLKYFFSIRAWPYRIIYEFDKKNKRIVIHKIQHRQGVYRG